MDKGAWRATVHGVAKSPTGLSAHTHALVHTHTHTLKGAELSPTSSREGYCGNLQDASFAPRLCVHSSIYPHLCGLENIPSLLWVIIQYVIFVVQTVPTLAIGSSCRIILVYFWHALLPFKGNFWKSKLYFAIHFCFTKHYLISAKAMSIYSSLCVCVCVSLCVCESVYVCAF